MMPKLLVSGIVPGGAVALSVYRDSEQIGGLLFTNFHPVYKTINVTGCGQGGWMSRRTFRKWAEYVFDTCGCQMMITDTSKANAKVQAALKKLGFSPTIVPRMCGSDTDGVLWTMTNDQWRKHPFNKVKN